MTKICAHDASGIEGALRSLLHPVLPTSMWNLGAVYSVRRDGAHLHVQMAASLAISCSGGVAPIAALRDRLMALPGTSAVSIVPVFAPAWTRDLLTEEGRLDLNVFATDDAAPKPISAAAASRRHCTGGSR